MKKFITEVSDYLDKLQSTAIASYTSWVSAQQQDIGLESNTWDDLYNRDQIKHPYDIPDPPNAPEVACPVSNK